MPTVAVSVVGAALSGVLCSGITAAVMRAREPDVVAIRGPLQLTVEQRALVELLVDPGSRFEAASVGAEVKATGPLPSLGFTRGWTRTFNAGRQQLDAFVLEFRDEAGARAYAGGIGGATKLLTDPVPFAVPGVPGASGLLDTRQADDGRYVHLVSLHRGPRAAVLVFRDVESGAGGDLIALAQRQYDALGGQAGS